MTFLRFSSIGFCLFMVAWTMMMDVGLSAPLPKEKELTDPFVKWVAKEGFVGNGPREALVVKDKMVVATNQGDVRAYRSSDGKLIWSQSYHQGECIISRPSSDGERIYFSSGKGVSAMAVKDGKKVWDFERASCTGPTFVLSNTELLYVGGNDGNLYALDTKTGEKRWTSDFIKDAPLDPPNFPGQRARGENTLATPSALASDGETLYLSVFDQSRIVAIHATTGKQLWSFQTGGWVGGRATTTSKFVFVGSQDRYFYCLDKKTGKEVWKYKTGWRVETGGVVDEKFVYFGSCDGSLYCLNQTDGKLRWQFAADLDEDGKKSAIYSVPLLHKGSVFFAACEGQVYGVDQETGKLKWKIRPSENSELVSSLVTDGKLFFLTSRQNFNRRGEDSLIAIGLK